MLTPVDRDMVCIAHNACDTFPTMAGTPPSSRIVNWPPSVGFPSVPSPCETRSRGAGVAMALQPRTSKLAFTVSYIPTPRARDPRNSFPRPGPGGGFVRAPTQHLPRRSVVIGLQHENAVADEQPGSRSIKGRRARGRPPSTRPRVSWFLHIQHPRATPAIAMLFKATVALASLAILANAVPHRRAACSNGRTASNEAVSLACRQRPQHLAHLSYSVLCLVRRLGRHPRELVRRSA